MLITDMYTIHLWWLKFKSLLSRISKFYSWNPVHFFIRKNNMEVIIGLFLAKFLKRRIFISLTYSIQIVLDRIHVKLKTNVVCYKLKVAYVGEKNVWYNFTLLTWFQFFCACVSILMLFSSSSCFLCFFFFALWSHSSALFCLTYSFTIFYLADVFPSLS